MNRVLIHSPTYFSSGEFSIVKRIIWGKYRNSLKPIYEYIVKLQGNRLNLTLAHKKVKYTHNFDQFNDFRQ